MASGPHDRAVGEVQALLADLGPAPTVEERRSAWNERFGGLPLAPGVHRSRAVVPGVDAEWLAAGGTVDAVVQYHHGGGYSGGSLHTHRQLASRLAVAGRTGVLNVGYRLAPEHRFPAAVDDALACYRWLLGTYPSDRIVLAGDSSGGGLAAGLVHALREEGLPLPAALVLIAPLVDVRPRQELSTDMFVSPQRTASVAELYLDGNDPGDPRVSPIAGALEGFPPTYLQYSADEALAWQSDQFADALRSAGVEVVVDDPPGLMHTWQVFAPDAPETHEAIARLGAFVRERVVPLPTRAESPTPRQEEQQT